MKTPIIDSLMQGVSLDTTRRIQELAVKSIHEETKCGTGPSQLFPDIPQCPNSPTEYVFHDPYCKECADDLRKLHKKLNPPCY